ncbi:MAG: hypothetical protein MJZ37_10585 [Bacilli bacterium]|nr:hypothetical protein [Bacilli bacterium]
MILTILGLVFLIGIIMILVSILGILAPILLFILPAFTIYGVAKAIDSFKRKE